MTRMMLWSTVLLAACTSGKETGETASSTDPTPTPTDTEPAALAIIGTYTDTWGGAHTIEEGSWVQDFGSYALTQYDNDAMYVVGQNDASNGYNPDLWSRFDWTWDDAGGLWYCQTAYNADSEAAALATAPADPSDPAASGCGGFSWTGLTPS